MILHDLAAILSSIATSNDDQVGLLPAATSSKNIALRHNVPWKFVVAYNRHKVRGGPLLRHLFLLLFSELSSIFFRSQ